ncbi:baculoviral IAP repeat-containing protein 8-like [Antedon mediterranea]|uniref:baculoviral IAP repeat-containing protein 8-like n=1 Tax=Antedon mediterranea TaxID=105859 RepID=UPI003AF9E93F
MECYERRLATYEFWIAGHVISPTSLAMSGFFYTGQEDRVECYRCHGKLSRWNAGADADTEHKKHFPFCKLMSCGNSSPLIGSKTHLVDSNSHMVRLSTFKNWPFGHIVSACTLAKSGFYYRSCCDVVECFSCNGLLERWKRGVNVDEKHRKHFPLCKFMLSTAATVATPTTTTTTTNNRQRAMHPQYALLNVRKMTFTTVWATDHTPNGIAEAGFFAINRDQAMCFHCGGGLKDWQLDDNPWIEHAKWFPFCNWLRIENGFPFIETALISSKSPFDIAMRSEIVVKVLEMGFDMQHVSTTVNDHVKRTGGNFTSTLELLNAVTIPVNDKPTVVEEEEVEEEEDVQSVVRDLREKKTCKICMDADVCVLFIPCSHLVACWSCSNSLLLCPICRGKIDKRQKAILS